MSFVEFKEGVGGKIGKLPEERTLAEKLKLGVVCVDKPIGPSSHEVSAFVKRILGLKKAGHTGTLDPQVSGVLEVLLGDSCKLAKYLMHSRKEYVCVTQLQDGFPESKIEEALDNFRGRIWQKPPVESAVARRLRVREIYSINLLEVERGGKLLLFSVDCEAGTYVRKIVSDLGLVLGTNAEMRELRRVKAGNFVEGDCVTLQELSDCKFLADKGKESLLRDWVQNLEQALHLREAFLLDESAVRACSAGIDVPAQGIARLDAGVNSGDAVALKTLKGELIGVARALLSAQEVEMLYEKNPIALDLERLVRSGF